MSNLSCVWLLAMFWAEEPNVRRYEFEQTHMGQPIKITLYAPDERIANLGADAAYARIAELDATLSDYKPDSELSKLSATAGNGRAVPLSRDLWTVLDRSQSLAEQTGGAFDVTVGPYVRLWRRARRNKEFPSQERLDDARRAVGYGKLKLDAAKHTAELAAPGMRLDLGGIAVGYAVDEAMAELRKHGITRALIDASGDMLVGDPPPGAKGWKIGIAPLDATGPPSRYLSLRRAAVTTSGDAFQHVVLDGKRYSHIVDPATGLGLTDQSSVTVIAGDCTTADSMATTVSVMGPEKGLKLIDSTPHAAAYIVRNVDGRIEQFVSDRFQEYTER
ncbi:MAG TPA: FAD:protein FMN transferase [Pirellulales bacterium]|nr:FAD:protein FMN transferase [Pirellulales bacterium]